MEQKEVESKHYKPEPWVDFVVAGANLEQGALAAKKPGWTEHKEAKNRCCKLEPRAGEWTITHPIYAPLSCREMLQVWNH